MSPKNILKDHPQSPANKDDGVTVYGISCLSESEFQQDDKPTFPCIAHDEKPVEAFCGVCWQPLCIQCILTNAHKGHDMLTLAAAEDKQKQILQNNYLTKVLPLREQLFIWSDELAVQKSLLEHEQQQALHKLKDSF